MIKLCILETKIFIVCYILNFIKDRIKFTFMDIRLFIVYSSTYRGKRSDAAVAKKANLHKSTFSRIKNELIPPKRNYLWSLAMSLELTLDEADELFSSCGLCMASQYHLTDMEKEREGIIKDCIAKEKYSVVELNIRLYEAGYQLLGNKGAN